ncbi:MAG TPA: hypothetical protein VLI43_05795 [Gemmatimonadaceae bacterium]|nr:hypothetical protein [Gemmatimonadaceae bacterium]
MSRSQRSLAVAVGAALLASACSGLVGASTQPEAEPAPAAPTISQEVIGQTPWPVKTRYVVDLWLHGLAMLGTDSSRTPPFRRDYRDEMIVAKNSRNILTQLDQNAEMLQHGLRVNPRLMDGARLALREGSWEEMGNDIAAFLTSGDDSASGRKRASVLTTWKRAPRTSEETTDMMAALGSVYRTDADREWLKVFALSLTDEHSKFYEQYWRERQRALRPSLAAVDTEFSQRYLKQFRSYLRGVQLPTGEIVLSLPLGGGGQSIFQGQHSIAIGFPSTADSSLAAVYEFAHEVAGPVAEQEVRERIAPAEFRAGLGAQLESPAKVRGGAMLLQRAVPELVAGYERYYLAEARVAASGDVDSAFVRAFPLRQSIIDGMDQRLDEVLKAAD